MDFNFSFGADTHAQADNGRNPPSEGYYMVTIDRIEDIKEQDGSVARFRLSGTIDPSYRIVGDPSAKLAKSYKYADDGQTLKLLAVALNISVEQLKAQGLRGSPEQMLVGKVIPVFFKPEGYEFKDEATGKDVKRDEMRIVSREQFQALRNAWIAEHPTVKIAGMTAGAAGGNAPTPGFQQNGAGGGFQQAPPQMNGGQQMNGAGGGFQQGGFQQMNGGFQQAPPQQGGFQPNGAGGGFPPAQGGFPPAQGQWTPPQS